MNTVHVTQHSSGGTRVYCIPVRAFPSLIAHTYVVLAGRYAALIDTGSGSADSNADLAAGFDALRSEWGETVRWRDLQRVIITHGHPDHCGGVGFVRTRTDAPIAVHVLDQRVVSAPQDFIASMRRTTRQFLQLAGAPATMLDQRRAVFGAMAAQLRGHAVATTLHDGDVLDGRFAVHHTPGHAAGQVCLQIDDLLFCADHLLSRTNPRLHPESIQPFNGLAHYFSALEAVAALPGVRCGLAGHEDVIDDVAARAAQIHAAHQDRLAQVRALCTTPHTIAAIAAAIYPELRHGDGQFMALEAAGARVEYLEQRGMLGIANVAQCLADDTTVVLYQTA